jgi:hypothetical protein
MSKASDATLSALHEALANDLARRLKEGEKVVEKGTGEIVQVDCPASTLSVIRQFLKDNDITALPVKGSPLDKLQGALPVAFGDDEEGAAGYH